MKAKQTAELLTHFRSIAEIIEHEKENEGFADAYSILADLQNVLNRIMKSAIEGTVII